MPTLSITNNSCFVFCIFRAQLRSAHQGQPLPSSLSILESTSQVRGLHAIIRLAFFIYNFISLKLLESNALKLCYPTEFSTSF